MDTEAIALALHDVTEREEIVDVAAFMLALAALAHAAGHSRLRDKLVARSAEVLSVCP
jgi:hypothetical protein